MDIRQRGSFNILFLVLFPLISSSSSAAAALCRNDTCTFTLDVRWARTLTYRDTGAGAGGRRAYNVLHHQDHLMAVSDTVGLEKGDLIGQRVNASDVITVDGTIRNIITINGQFPGPAIEVMEGATVRFTFE